MNRSATMTMLLPVVFGLVLTAGTMVLAQAPPAAPERVTTGLAALYRADSVTDDGVLPNLSPTAEPLNLEIRSGAQPMVRVEDDALIFGPPAEPVVPGVFSPWPAESLIRAIKQSGQLTVEAWIVSANTDQKGPARIVSISRDTGSRNMTLGQDRSQFVLRLRTSETNEQGTPELCTPEGSVLAGQLQHVVATYDGARATFYLDGQPVADTTHFAGDAGIGTLQNWDETMHFMLGNEFTGERLWSGAIHLVAFYTQALTAEQVQANFQAGL